MKLRRKHLLEKEAVWFAEKVLLEVH